MCKGGGGSPPVPSGSSTAFQSTVTPSAFATPLYQDFLNRANSLSNTPFNPAMQGSVAPLNASQNVAMQDLFNKGLHMGDFDPGQVQSIMSPYIGNVVSATQNWFNNQNAIQGNDLMSQAIRSGNAFGGDRAGVAEGVLAGQQQLAQAPVIAGLYQSGYGQALDEYNRLKQFGITGAGAALGVGSMQQAQQQRELDVAQQNAMMSSAYPFQTLNWYGAILGGIAPLLGSQAVGYNTPPTPGGAGFKRGGMVLERRKQGGLVPVFVRHNGGIIAGLAYGGSTDDEEDKKEERHPSESESPDTSGTPELPERERSKSWGSEIGQLQTSGRGAPPQAQFASGTPQQQQSTMSKISEGVGTLGKVIEVGSKVAPFLALMSDPSTKTDVQRVGKTDDDEPLYAFRYKGDPKTYPKVVGPMARPMGGTIPRPRGYADAGEVLSDESEYPIEPGQQYARDYAGRATWFNPRNEQGGYTYRDESGRDWTDYGAMRLREGPHKSGLPSTTRGFATEGSADLGNWFEINVGGRKAYAQKTDQGPPGVVDLNAPLAASMGFNPNNVSGRATVRDLGRTKPPEAGGDGGTQWPDPSKGNVGTENLPSGEQGVPRPVPGAQLGRAPTPATAGPQGGGSGDYTPPPRGMGPVGGRIPGAPGILGGITDVAKEALRNPLLQLAGGYLSGTSPWGRVNLGNALLKTAGIQEAQRTSDLAERRADLAERRQNLLDQKPELIHTEKGMAYKYPDGTITHLGMKGATQALAERKQQASEATPFELEEKVGEGLFQGTRKVPYVIDPNDPTKIIPFQPQGAQPQAQPQQQQQAPGQQQAPPTGVGNAPVRQSEAPPPPPPPYEAGDSGAAPVQPPTQTAPTQVVQVQTPPVVPPTTGPGGKGPADSYEGGWGGVMPIGTVTNPGASGVNRNENALANATPQQANLIKGIVDYKIDPKSIPMRDPKTGVTRAQWLEAATAYDPNYNQAQYATRAAALKEFGVNGQAQKSLQSNSMVLEHIGDAMTAVDGLKNSTNPTYNKITGQWQYEVTNNTQYQAAVARFKSAAGAAATEAAKTFRGVGSMSQQEAAEWNKILAGVYDSPVALRSAMQTVTGLVAGRLHATVSGYNQAMGPDYYRSGESFMTPKARETLSRAATVGDTAKNEPFAPSKYEWTQPNMPAKPLQGPEGGGQQPPQGGGSGGGWKRDPTTGNVQDPNGRWFTPDGKPLQ